MDDNKKYDRTNLSAEQSALLDSFPVLSAEDLTSVNNLFRHYVFYRTEKGGRRLWTSCCQTEGKFFGDVRENMCHSDSEVSYGKHNDVVKCPYCGHTGELKNVGRCGRFSLVSEGRNVMILHAGEGGLYAQAYIARKRYDSEHLAIEPEFSFAAAYFFEFGRATMFTHGWENWYCSHEERRIGKKRNVNEPFYSSFRSYENYYVVNSHEVDKSPLKYCRCGLAHADTETSWLMRYLSVYSVYPQQTEMLIKAGLKSLVNDLTLYRTKNADIFKWEETDPRRAFALDGQTLKQWLASGADTDALRLYRLAKRRGLIMTLEQAANIAGTRGANLKTAKEFLEFCAVMGQPWDKAYRYLMKRTGTRCYGAYYGFTQAYQCWKDYIDAARILEYDLNSEVVIFPKELEAAHDQATATFSAINNEKLASAQKEMLEKYYKRYSFEFGDWLIRPADSAEEIIKEGKLLEHCVGGYADRYIKGTVIILFLRAKCAPDKPLVTIEMDGAGIRQIHGYRNDRDSTSPQKEYAEILKPWLSWLKKGSKRNKAGEPVLPGAKKKKAAEAA